MTSPGAPLTCSDITNPDVAKADAHAWNADPLNASVPLLAMAGPWPWADWNSPDWTVWLIKAPNKTGMTP